MSVSYLTKLQDGTVAKGLLPSIVVALSSSVELVRRPQVFSVFGLRDFFSWVDTHEWPVLIDGHFSLIPLLVSFLVLSFASTKE